MRWGESRTVALKSIIAPGDIARRQATGEVIELAGTITEFGNEPINPLTVMKVRKGWQLIAGRDRYSALALAGIKNAPVRVVEDATPQELHDMEVVENLNRRIDDRNKLIAERVRKVAENIAAKRDPNVTTVTPTRSDKSEARKAVAAALDVQPAAIRQAEHRGKVRSEAAAPEAQGIPVEASAPPIETFGHELPEHVRERVVTLLAELARVEAGLKQAARVEFNVLTLVPANVARIKEHIAAGIALVRSMTPTHLCPYCKAQYHCDACSTTGYVTRAVFDSAPAEMRGAPEANEANDCAHAYRAGAVPTGVCLHCGAAGAETWTKASEMPRGPGAPKHDVTDAGWATAHGPGSDRKSEVAKPKKLRGVRIQINDGPEMTAAEAEAFLAAGDAPPMNEPGVVDEEGIPF